jgi:hypothetical protein
VFAPFARPGRTLLIGAISHPDLDLGADAGLDLEKMGESLGVVGADPAGGEDVGGAEDRPVGPGSFGVVDQVAEVAFVLSAPHFVSQAGENLFSEIHEEPLPFRERKSREMCKLVKKIAFHLWDVNNSADFIQSGLKCGCFAVVNKRVHR